MSEEQNPSPEITNRREEMDAVMKEYDQLLDMALDQHKKDLHDVSKWFDGVHEQVMGEIIAGKKPSMNGKELAKAYLKKMEEAGERTKNTIEKLRTDAHEKLKDARYKGMADEYINEINSQEWKKYFGDL